MSHRPHFFKPPHKITCKDPKEPVLVALSGGADSSVLLHLLCDYAKESGCKISAAHLNHGIRGEKYNNEADRDESFCRSLCASLGVELFVRRLDIPRLSEDSGRSLETEAREARYAFFEEIMTREKINILATAHNADDNLETQIFNLCRGCGTDGLVGIPEKRTLGNEKTVIRPILSAEKKEIFEYCKKNGIEYVQDSTNNIDDCTRNAIRLRLIPELEGIFPTAKRSAQRLSSNAAEDSDYINEAAKAFLEDNPTPISAAKLSALHIAPRKRVLAFMFAKVSDSALESVHINALCSLLESRKNGASISLPGEYKAQMIDGNLVFSKDTRCKKTPRDTYFQSVTQGFNEIENTPFALLLTEEEQENERTAEKNGKKYALYTKAALNIPKDIPISARNRTPGASILDGGINKSVKKLMCDKKVPLLDRDTLPIVYCGENAVYLPLCAVADSAKAKGQNKKTYIYVYKTISED